MRLNTNELVTVVTVTYNAVDLLESTINSVLDQTYDNIEYIIIDGASTDETVKIIEKYDARISYWISEPDEGIYFAMNKALDKATGEFINFMNAGDIYADGDSVRYVMQNKDHGAELIYGDHIRLDPYQVHKAQDKSRWYSAFPFCHQTLFTRTDLVRSVMFDTRYRIAADHDFIIKMYEENRVFQYLEHNLVIYAAGGISQNEPLIACVESLYILLHSNATVEQVEMSWWYKLLMQDMSADHATNVEGLWAEFRKLASIKIFRHPFRKIRQYKKLMKTYHSFK